MHACTGGNVNKHPKRKKDVTDISESQTLLARGAKVKVSAAEAEMGKWNRIYSRSISRGDETVTVALCDATSKAV